MLKWFSAEEGEPGSGGPGSPLRAAGAGELAVEEAAERLSHTELLVTQLKEMIREKDATLRTKDEQLKVEKEACDAKLSKLRLQNKAKVTSLTSQLEELKRQQGGPGTPTHSKKGSSEAGEQASRGKIVLLKKKVEELEQQLAQRNNELENKRKEVESQRQRGEEMDTMLTEKERKLVEKEAYIVHLQTALAGDQPVAPPPQQVVEEGGAMQELQLLVQSLTRKVGEAEERYSLLQEQAESLKELLVTEKEQYAQKENMYKQNIQTFKDILIQKDNQLMEINQMHEQELFKLAAKSDASADLEQLLKALKQKLHEKEEVLLGKTQVIDVLQGEVDGRDQQIQELTEKLRRLQVERESLASKMEAEKHVMRAQLRDLMEKQQAEVQRLSEQHRSLVDQAQQDFLEQLEELRRTSGAAPPASQEASESGSMTADSASIQRMAELEAQAKQKTDEASRSDAKFLKMKAWSKSRIRQLEEELKKSQAGGAPPDLTALRSHITALEEEREENLWKVEQYEELKTKNEMLEAKLVVYEEQQRSLQADLEQFNKRAASQASESGSADDSQSQVLEWQEMVTEAVSARDRAKEEKVAMALRISHMEEEREALASRQQELEEELAQSRGLGQHRVKKLTAPAQRSLQEDFEFDGQVQFQDPRSASQSTPPMEGENMGDGLRSVVEELELERNQLQEQILSLEERCQDLEDRQQLQSRMEAFQNESEKLQSQLASVRIQQSRDAEKHQLLVASLTEQLKGLSNTQECLESSLIEKENTLAKTSEKLELIGSLRESLSEKEIQFKDVSERLLQTEHTLDNVSTKCSRSEKHCSELKAEVCDLTQKFTLLKEKTQKQEVAIEALQTELDQTNEELDKLNSAHLEERAQLIHDLQTCEREIDSLREVVAEKDKEISSLSANMVEYTEQITVLKQEMKLKEENLVQVETALRRAEQQAMIIRDSQDSDQQSLNSKITEAVEKLKDTETELVKAKEERESKEAEVEQLLKQLEDDKKTMQELRVEIQKQTVSHRHHLSECETHITSLKEQLSSSTEKLQESEELVSQLQDKNINSEELQQQLHDKEETYEKELKSFKEEHNKLLAQAEKYKNELQTLSTQLEEQVQSEAQIRKEMRDKVETIETLEKQLKTNGKQTSEKQRLSNELKNKTENISKLKNLLKSTKTEKQQLTEELELQRQSVKELNEKVTSALELNGSLENQLLCLTQEKQGLEVEVSESVKNISDVTAEKDSLQAQISGLMTQCSQNDRAVEGLQRDKEELTLQVHELNGVLEQSTSSNSEMLLEKTNKCSRLSQQLREREEKVTELQEHVQNLSSEVKQLRSDVAEKEKTSAELHAQLKAEQDQRSQSEEALGQLRGRESSLRSELTEKDAVLKEKQDECRGLQEEITAQKDMVSKLQEEHSQLRLQVQTRDEMLDNTKQQCENHKDKLNSMNETVKSQSDRISVMEENARKLQNEAELKQTELSRLDELMQALTEENHQLGAAAESREKKLALQTSELDSQLHTTLEHNSSLSMKISKLTEDNQRLQDELDQNSRSVSELTTEMSLLREKNAGLEIHISDDKKRVGSLLKEKKKLSAAVDELRKILKESELSNSAALLEKTSECAHLSKTLREREEQLQSLQEEVDSLKMQESQLNMSLSEKDQTLSERRIQSEAHRDQLLQLHDTVSALQEQASVLKSGLMEKDASIQQKAEECSVYQKEVELQKDLVSKLQVEVESTKRTMEQKEQTLSKVSTEFQNHKDELNKRNESVTSLSGQLGAMNESAAEMEAEINNLKAAVQKLRAENSHLTQEDGRSKAEMIDFKDSFQALNEQNTRLKSELLNTETVLSKAQEEVANLKTSVNAMEKELKTAFSEQETLHLSVKGKDDRLKQEESLIQQLNGRIAEQEQRLKQNAEDKVSLCAKVSELEDSASKLRGHVNHLTAESSILKNTLDKKEQSSLEYQSHSSAAVENLNSILQAREAEGERLKEQTSHLEESVSKLSSSLQAQLAESENLKKALVEREAALLNQSQSLQDVQRQADESLLFKTQFMESTELVSQLQSQIQLLSTEYENLRTPAEETQSAFKNLQEKYAANLEELQEVRQQLSSRADEVSNLQKLLDDSNNGHQAAKMSIETLRHEFSDLQQRLKKTKDLNSSLSKEKEEAFSSHQASVSLLTVEIERLKSQHLQVAAQMNALTENLEQRELALHAINSQYTAQAKHASQLVSEIQKLEEQNKRLSEEMSLSTAERQKHLDTVCNESSRLQEEVRKLLAVKEELETSQHQIRTSHEELQLHMQQQASSMKENMEQMVSEREILQAKVSAKDEELSQLTENIQKIEQILQDSEKEWLLVLDKEKQDRNRLAEQLKSVENEKKSKDVKVNALKRDLDSLQEKLAEASSAVRQGSDQLSAKESEASASRIQLEKLLASFQEKDKENHDLQQNLNTVECELEKLLPRKLRSDKDSTSSELNTKPGSLQDMIKQLEDRHQSEVDALRNELDKVLHEGGRSEEVKSQQVALLRDEVERLRTQLTSESQNLKEAAVKLSSLHSEVQAKDEQINSLGCQINQQKELLAGLSQQMRDKDASVAQVMESASNERVKLCEEKTSLMVQVENMQRAHETSTRRSEELEVNLQQLEDTISRSQCEINSTSSEKLELLRERDDLKGELAKLSKEKDGVKKKLQAALVVRKDLMKKLQEYEKQKEESVNSEKQEVSLLQDKLQETTHQAQATAEKYQEQVSLLEHTILRREGEIEEHKTQSERLLEQLESEKLILQSTLNQKEMCLLENLQTLSEQTSVVEQLQSNAAEAEEASERDRNALIRKVEQLQDEIRTRKNELQEKSSSAAAELENELAQVKSEKAVLQKKAQAALLARKETMKKAQENEKKLTQELAELKDDYKALLEQRCQQTNELNAIQINLDEKVRELENLHRTSLSYLDELGTLRQLVEERDKTLQDLKMSLAEKESQCHSLSLVQSELETVRSQAEKMSLEMATKEDVLVVTEQRTEALKSQLHLAENDLERVREEVREKTEEIEKYKQTIQVVEEVAQQEKQKNISYQHMSANEEKFKIVDEEKEAALEQMKVELETALALVSQKSLEVLTIQKTLTETQQQLIEDKLVLTEELEEAHLHRTETDRVLGLFKQEKENAFQSVRDLRGEVTALTEQLKEAERLNQQLHQETPENLEVKLKERDEALLVSQARVAEKDELIAALEQQLQQRLHTHDTAIERMRVEADELQKSQEDGNKANSRDIQSKITLLTRKLQAALLSRKELLKETATLKEEVEKLSARHEAKSDECSVLESSVVRLKQQNSDLETSVSSLNKEKEELNSSIDRVRDDNLSLSAACDSLKLTIENMTQQKQAFSCQLESLKDSQTDELSKWKSRHAELKQEYESLLESYENVSSEMDKMRQFLEGAKRDRQEAVRKAHSQQTETETMEKQARDMEEENERIKERMRKSSKEKLQRINDLEEENQKIKLELTEHEGKQKTLMCELTDRNTELEAERRRLEESSEDLREKLTEIQAERSQLEEKLEEASSSLENSHTESNTYTSNMQLKLDEALGLNNSLTAQIEAQKTELGAQLEINNLLQKEKKSLSERIEEVQNDHELQLGQKDEVIKELKDDIYRRSRETIGLNEKVRILEDDKSVLQEELENVQETSDKVKNENEYLESVILKNSERIDEQTESVGVLQTQNTQLASQLAAIKERSDQVRQEKEEEQLKLVRGFEEKLKTEQRGNQGSKNVRNELRELLKEKHQEINQLQQNCIRYQELILDLESSLKSSQSACDLLEKEVKKGSEKVSALEERSKEVEAALITNRNLLQEAAEKIQSVQTEKEQLLLEMSQQSQKSEEKRNLPQVMDERQINAYMQNQFVLQQQIDELKELKDEESVKVNELRQHVDAQNLQMNTLKRAAETNEAKLSALSSTARGAHATKRWSDMYQKTLNEKDNQLLEQGFVIKRFLEDMRVKDKEVNELRVTKSRLERTLSEYSVAAAAQQRQLFVMSASSAELSESAELMTVQVKELSAQVERTERDKNGLNRRLVDKEDVISRLQLNLQQVEKINADTDAQLLLLQTQNDKLRASFEKQEGISLQLKTLLQGKDAEISSLLSSRDGQMSGYLEQLQANYRSQVAVYEDRLTSSRYQREKADKGLRGFETKVKSLQIKANKSVQEKEQMAAKMESFKNSMVSLQSERERLVSEYRILEAKSELGLKGKDGSADGEGGAAKGLKHEIRKLLHQMDDLNSENAMLRAQLVRYREDLNQVLSLKDNQLKVLLKKQQEVIKNLENQKAAVDKQHRKSRLELQKEEEVSDSLTEENSKLTAQVSRLEMEISTQKLDRATTDVGKVISDLQEAVAAKAAECNDLQQKLFSQKTLNDEVKANMQLVENETDKKLAEAEDKYNSELDAFEREVELMRNEHETAEQRVAELARDLLQVEQQLSEARTQSKDLTAQNESLCKAMAALQNDRDQLIEDFKVLRNRYDEELRETQAALTQVERSLQDATSDLAMFAKERDILVHKVNALDGKDTDAELNKLLDELTKALSEKEKELKQVSMENNTYSRQLSAFSRSMASLQNDRDRLMDELAGTKRAVESRQGSSPETTSSKSEGSGVSFLPSERDGRETDELQQTHRTPQEGISSREEAANLRTDRQRKDSPPVKQEAVALSGRSVTEEAVSRLEAERLHLHGNLQRCVFEIQQRDVYVQQLSTKLQQAVEEKGAVAAQLTSVSQTLRDTQNRCHWLERPGQAQGSVYAEVAPGAPQERSNDSTFLEPEEVNQLRERLQELEQILADERSRRETAEESLRLADDRTKGLDAQRDFSIEMEPEDEWEALSLDPTQPLIARQVKGGVAACRRWLRGRSLYFSKLLTSRARSRHLFLFYLLTIHVLVLMCLTGAL
ncbi:golgin subfamily B member 1-like [Limanda limanda]|uniref:golgin subfamily B member 1-like n=1 Tax=Limanda limanda TaxID=27771 RepID=UPI0029C95953|nr:golgin subfamily B member 1-like [Limanda limanda]